MIKAFENYEIWFITGAQLLYGGDAVKQVDGHSKEMVAGLNDSGRLPIKWYIREPQIAAKKFQNFSQLPTMRKMYRCNNMDAHILSCQDVDTRTSDTSQATTPLAYTI